MSAEPLKDFQSVVVEVREWVGGTSQMDAWRCGGVGGFCIFTGGRIYVRMYIHMYQ